MLLHKRIILNFLLAMVACSLAMGLYLSWTRDIPSPPTANSFKEEKRGPKPKNNGQIIPPQASYKSVTEKNLFSPDRREYVPEPKLSDVDEEPVVSIAKISGKTVELHAVVQIGDEHSGLVLNPNVTTKRKLKWVVEGDRVGNLQVTDIFPDRLMLRDGREKFEILLTGNKAKRNAPAPVVRNAPKVISTASPGKRSSAIDAKNGKNSAETKIIHTPFGDVVRKK